MLYRLLFIVFSFVFTQYDWQDDGVGVRQGREEFDYDGIDWSGLYMIGFNVFFVLLAICIGRAYDVCWCLLMLFCSLLLCMHLCTFSFSLIVICFCYV